MAAEPRRTDRLIGEILADRYQILERLGEGAMGVVFRARHVRVGRAFAVKVLHPHLLDDGKTAVRFEREAELAGRLRHPNVVGVVDVGAIDGLRYMVMDLAEGPDLAQLLGEAPLPRERIVHLVRQILEGLYHAHEHGLIHRDLKPENVIVERDSHGLELPRIVDFGIAILSDNRDTVDGLGRLTTNGLVLGTPHYMAPEQAVADPIDHRIDLFALGIVIYEMLSGRLPFDGSGAEIARANLLLDPPKISHRVPHLEVDPLLEAFARCLMAKKPSARPPTAKAARELLDLIERDRPAAAAALGLPPTMSLRIPAATQPVTQQQPSAPIWSPVPPPTLRLKATPISSEPLPGSAAPVMAPQAAVLLVPAAVLPGPAPVLRDLPNVVPSPSLVLASAAVGHARPAPVSNPRQPAARPAAVLAQPTLEVAPLAITPESPRMSEAPPTPLLQRDLQTAIRTPLDWGPPKRTARKPWLIASVAVAAVSMIAIVVVVSTGGAHEPPAREPRAPAITTNHREPSGGSSVSPLIGAPRAVDAPVAQPETTALVMPPSAEPDSGSAAAATRPPPRRPRTHDLGARSARAIDTRASEAPVTSPAKSPTSPVSPASTAPASPASTAPSHVKPTDASPRETGPTEPDREDAPPARGISPTAVATLYYAVPKALDALATDQSRDLREQFRRYNIQALMLAPQAERDGAAEQLSLILREAARRKAASGDKPRRTAP